MTNVLIMSFNSIFHVLRNKSVFSSIDESMSWTAGLRLSFLTGLLCTLSMPALARDEGLTDYFEELPVVLTASRLQQTPAWAPAAISIIDRDMITASGARRLEEVLRLVPGFFTGYVSGSAPITAYHGLSDAYARRMQVLVDGVSVYSPLWGGVSWIDLPLELQDIERIEVVRGPNAASFGANAFLAVINIITRDPATEPGVQLASQLGENGVRDVAVRVAQQKENWRYRLGVSQQHDNGFAFLPDTSRIDRANLRVHWQLDTRHELALRLGSSRGVEEQGFYNPPANDAGVQRPRQVSYNSLHLRWTQAQAADLETWLQVHHFDQSLREAANFQLLVPGFPAQPYHYDFNFDLQRDEIELQQTRRASEALRLVWGAQWRNDRVVSRAFFNHADRLESHLMRGFAQLEWRLQDSLSWQSALMLEHNNLTGQTSSPRHALIWQLSPGQSLHLATSKAHRTPTLYELYTNQTYDLPPILAAQAPPGVPGKIVAWSSGQLRDETITTRELVYVIERPEQHLNADVRLFADRIENLIHLERIRPVTSVLSNMAYDYFNTTEPVRQHGLELSLRWQPWPQTTVDFTHAVVRTRTLDVLDRQSVPRHTSSLMWRQQINNDWQASSSYYRRSRLRWLNAPVAVDAFDTLDLRLSRRWRWQGQTLESALLVRDALGDYQDYNLNNTQRRLWAVQLNYSY